MELPRWSVSTLKSLYPSLSSVKVYEWSVEESCTVFSPACTNTRLQSYPDTLFKGLYMNIIFLNFDELDNHFFDWNGLFWYGSRVWVSYALLQFVYDDCRAGYLCSETQFHPLLQMVSIILYSSIPYIGMVDFVMFSPCISVSSSCRETDPAVVALSPRRVRDSCISLTHSQSRHIVESRKGGPSMSETTAITCSCVENRLIPQ